MLQPRSPTLPLQYVPCPRDWALRIELNQDLSSQNIHLQCTRAELAAVEEAALVIILDVQCDNPSKLPMQIMLGNIRMDSSFQDTGQESGAIYLWGVLPRDRIPAESTIKVNTLLGDSLYEVGNLIIQGIVPLPLI